MHTIKIASCLVLLTSLSLSTLPLSAAQTQSNAHKHINHLMKSWPDAPQGMGLLPTAIKEAAIASLEIQLAKVQDKDLNWIKLHITRAKHALRAKEQGEGGLGFGLVKASYAIAKHTKLAAADDASINVKLHSKTIINSAYNTASVAKKMARICDKIIKSDSIKQSLDYIEQLIILSDTLLVGTDLDKDGKISSFHKEGGLTLAKEQLTFMARAEGLIKMKR